MEAKGIVIAKININPEKLSEAGPRGVVVLEEGSAGVVFSDLLEVEALVA